MQPEPNEIPQKTSLTSTTQDNHSDSQHGFDQPTQRQPVQPLAEERRSKPKLFASDSASSTSGSDVEEALEYPLRRLSPPSRPHTRSPVNRVAEYEKASTKLPKRRTEGPAFTVVPKGKKSTYDRVAITHFPNGPPPSTMNYTVANCCRGVDSYTLSLTACFVGRRLSGLQTISSASHNATCLENCFFAFLPWKRGVECAGGFFRVISSSRCDTRGKASIYSPYSSCILAERVHFAYAASSLNISWQALGKCRISTFRTVAT